MKSLHKILMFTSRQLTDLQLLRPVFVLIMFFGIEIANILSMKNDFSKQFLPILERANKLAVELGSSAIRPEHLVLAALRNKDGYAFK
ncbi:MAG: hypothetical protein K2M03_06105, partial [Muribaculaceae bacterium]|nr:hypothetical protein [Muribaculaceae bacterium]